MKPKVQAPKFKTDVMPDDPKNPAVYGEDEGHLALIELLKQTAEHEKREKGKEKEESRAQKRKLAMQLVALAAKELKELKQADTAIGIKPKKQG